MLLRCGYEQKYGRTLKQIKMKNGMRKMIPLSSKRFGGRGTN